MNLFKQQYKYLVCEDVFSINIFNTSSKEIDIRNFPKDFANFRIFL